MYTYIYVHRYINTHTCVYKYSLLNPFDGIHICMCLKQDPESSSPAWVESIAPGSQLSFHILKHLISLWDIFLLFSEQLFVVFVLEKFCLG